MSDGRKIDGLPDYLVFDSGEIISLFSGKALKQKVRNNGYKEVCLYNNKKKSYHLVHRIVATAFIPNPTNLLEINHKDGNRFNNSTENLEWCSRNENLKHAFNAGLTPFDTSSKGVVCWKKHEPENRLFFHSIYNAARALRISQGNICMVCRGQRPLASGYVFQYSV